MKQAKQFKTTISGKLVTTQTKDGEETNVKVQTKEECLSDKSRPITEFVLESEENKLRTFKDNNLPYVRKQANDGKETSKSVMYWKEVEQEEKEEEGAYINIEEQSFKWKDVKKALQGIEQVPKNANRNKVVEILKELNEDKLDQLLIKLES